MTPFVYKHANKAMARFFRTPTYLIFFVSDRCWLKCRHCWFNEDWKAEQLGDRILTLDEIARIAESVGRLFFLSLTGGEAFTRPELIEIVELFVSRTKLNRYQIPTSGFKPDLIVSKTEALLRKFRQLPFRVDVSVDGTESVHDRIRCVVGSHRRAMETIRGLNELKRHYANFDVGIITTISHDNQHEVSEIGNLIEKINPDGEWMVNIVRGNIRDPNSSAVDVSSYRAAHQLIRRRIEAGCYRGHTGHRTAAWLSAKNATRRKIILRTLVGSIRGGGCAAGALGGVIYSDGAVQACEMLNDSLGNVRDFDYDLGALWNSKKADRVRCWIQDTRCQCTQECFLSISLLIQPQHWPDIIRERIRLLRNNNDQALSLSQLGMLQSKRQGSNQ